MSRLLLVIAMLVSLWPIGLIAASAASDSSTSEESASQSAGASSGAANSTSGDTSTDDGSAGPQVSPPEPDYTAYKSLRRRTDKLLKRLDASRSLEGVANPRVAGQARQLAADYADWDAANGELDSDLHRLAVAQRRIAQRVAVFAADPTQQRLDRFNAAIDQFNRTLRAVQR
jgi:hypothetical protein